MSQYVLEVEAALIAHHNLLAQHHDGFVHPHHVGVAVVNSLAFSPSRSFSARRASLSIALEMTGDVGSHLDEVLEALDNDFSA